MISKTKLTPTEFNHIPKFKVDRLLNIVNELKSIKDESNKLQSIWMEEEEGLSDMIKSMKKLERKQKQYNKLHDKMLKEYKKKMT